MKHVRFLDAQPETGLSVFQATEDEFGVLFPAGQTRQPAAAVLARLGDRRARRVLQAIGLRPVRRPDPLDVHGVLVFAPRGRAQAKSLPVG